MSQKIGFVGVGRMGANMARRWLRNGHTVVGYARTAATVDGLVGATPELLVRRTGDDLLECKNFGVTSLNEVREKLTLHSLKLRGD